MLAAVQTAGRGRQGRHWVSSPGNLFMSIILRPRSGWAAGARTTDLAFVTAVAAAEAIGPGVTLKWPNDLLLAGRKVGGILIETEDAAAIAGIGVNVATALGEGTACLGPGVAAEDVCRRVASATGAWFDRWQDAGFAAIRDAWLQRGHRPGEALRVRGADGWLTGHFAGLDTDGALLLRQAAGVRRIVTGDVNPAADRSS